jgi:hypothetical protein
MDCCYKWLFGGKKEDTEELKKDLLDNEIVSEKIKRSQEDSNSIGTQTDNEENEDDASSESSTLIDSNNIDVYGNDIDDENDEEHIKKLFKSVDSDEIKREQLDNSIYSELSEADTVVS